MMTSDLPRKVCVECGLEKSSAEFHRLKKSPDGLKPKCIKCMRLEYKQLRTVPLVSDKRCQKCKEIKPAREFNLARGTPDRLQKRCRDCTRHDQRNNPLSKVRAKGHYHRMTPEEKLMHALRSRLSKYKLSHEQYENMLAEQNGLCAICNGVSINGRNLSIDHNHTTGKVRQLLCMECNSMLGYARERKDLLLKGVEYLQKHEEVPCG